MERSKVTSGIKGTQFPSYRTLQEHENDGVTNATNIGTV